MFSMKSFKLVGERCTVGISPDSDKIITIYKTSSKTINELKGG